MVGTRLCQADTALSRYARSVELNGLPIKTRLAHTGGRTLRFFCALTKKSYNFRSLARHATP